MRILAIVALLFIAFQNFLPAQNPTQTDSLLYFAADSIPGSMHITEDQIKHSPTRGLQNYLQYLPGVYIQDGLLHIRGNGSNENSYSINGFDLTGPFYGLGIHIIPEAIKEIAVIPGNFSAGQNAFGTALIATSLKTGGSNFNAQIEAQTDKFAAEGSKFLNTYSYREHVLTGVFGGAIFKRHRFFVAVENHEIGDTQKRFSSGFRFDNLVDQNFYNPAVREGHPDTVDIRYPDGFTPRNRSNRWAVNTSFTFDFNPLTVEIIGLYDHYKFYTSNIPMFMVLNDREFYTVQQTAFIGSKLRYRLGAKNQLNLKLAYYAKTSEKFDDYLGNNWQKWADSAAVVRASNGKAQFRDRWNGQYDYVLNGFHFKRTGSYEDYEKYKHTWFEAGLNFTRQLTRSQQLGIGFDWRKFSLRQYAVNPFVMRETEFYGTLENIPLRVFDRYSGVNYGYDVTGKETQNGWYGPKKPSFQNVYLTYQFTHKNLRLNVGMRYNRIDTKISVLKDPANPDIDRETGRVTENSWKELAPLSSWNPRFSFEYVLNPGTYFYVHYGLYTLLPSLQAGYGNLYQTFVVNGNYYSVPIFSITKLTQFSSFQSGFWKRFPKLGIVRGEIYLRNQQNNRHETKYISSLSRQAALFNLSPATDIMGFELSYAYTGIKRFRPQIQYNYLDAKIDKSHVPYQIRHRFLANLEYRLSGKEGGPIFKNFGINLSVRLASGHPYIAVSNIEANRTNPVYGLLNAVMYSHRYAFMNETTTPWTSYVDLFMDKSFVFKNNSKITFYVRITNLLNKKNVINVYPNTGSAEDDGFISNPEQYEAFVKVYGPEYLDLYKAINVQNGQAYWSLLGKQLYGHPRQIFVGINFSY